MNVSWPATRLARWSLSLLLGAALYLPSVAGRAQGWRWLTFMPVAVLIAFLTRLLFADIIVSAASRNRVARAAGAIVAALIGAWMAAVASMLLRLSLSPARTSLTFVFSLGTLVVALALRSAEVRTEDGLRRVYFVGTRSCALDLQRELARCHGRRLVGMTLVTAFEGPLDLTRLAADVVASGATVATVDGEAMQLVGIDELADCVRRAGVSVNRFAPFYEAEFKKVSLAEQGTVQPVLASRGFHAATYRTLDIVIATILLVGLLPLLAVAAVAIRLTSDGPALYRQRRAGRGEVPFTLIKLRTMTMSCGEPSWLQFDAHRITGLGRHLRRFRIDELPQLWNVLRGELALIGPRPEQVPMAASLAEKVPHYRLRHCVRPGLTGWAQVNLGYAGSVEGTVAKLQRDLFYIKRRSLRLDALIIWLTLETVLSGRGSSYQLQEPRPAIDEHSVQKASSPCHVHGHEDR